MQKNWRKTTKKFDLSLDRSNREKECLKTFWKVSWPHENQVLKKLSIRFSIDRKLGSIDRKCFNWSNINWASIKINRGWPKILNAISINQKTGLIDRNSRKKQIFEKQSNFVQKLLKALNFMNKMHEYEMKYFSEIQVLNPIFPKLRVSIHSP